MTLALTLIISRIQLDTLGRAHSVSVNSCHLCFLRGEPHLLQVFGPLLYHLVVICCGVRW